MVSLQPDIFPWLDYEPYMNPFYTEVSPTTNYSSYLEPVGRYQPDPILERWMEIVFVDLYARYVKSFTKNDRYTLFVPVHSKMAQLVDQFPSGNSSQDQWRRVHIQNQLENKLRRHMVKYRIDPSLILHQDTQIETVLGDHISIDSNGIIDNDPTNRITHYVVYPHATLFFISHERSDQFYK